MDARTNPHQSIWYGRHEALVVGVPLDEIDPEDHILNYKKSLEKMLNEVPIEPKKTKDVTSSAAPL